MVGVKQSGRQRVAARPTLQYIRKGHFFARSQHIGAGAACLKRTQWETIARGQNSTKMCPLVLEVQRRSKRSYQHFSCVHFNNFQSDLYKDARVAQQNNTFSKLLFRKEYNSLCWRPKNWAYDGKVLYILFWKILKKEKFTMKNI